MNNIKNEKGITLIVLIVTIIIMLIILSVTIYVGTESIDSSKVTKFIAYMQAIQKKVDIIVEYEDYTKYGKEVTPANLYELQEILNSKNEQFLTKKDSQYLRFFDKNDIAKDLEIENVDDQIIVDFQTREVVSLNGIKYEGEKYYTQYFLPGGQTIIENSDTERSLEVGNITTKVDGLNGTFTIDGIGISNGTLSYGKKGEDGIIDWTTITNYTRTDKAETTRNISESGVYYFKLVDNATNKDNADSDGNYPSVTLKLTNMPKLKGNLTDLSTTYNYSNINKSSNWAFATDKSTKTYYVWIPRFAYKLDSQNKLKELEFLRGTSNVTTSGGYIEDSEWTIPEVFADSTNQYTGIWIKVNSLNQDNIDIIDILTNGIVL